MADDPKVDSDAWKPEPIPVAENQEPLFDPSSFLRKPTPEELASAQAMGRDFIRWRDAEKDPNHQMIHLGMAAECSCGWKSDGGTDGGSWSAHFSAVHR